MQTCLERRGMDERHAEILRNDYNIHDQYSETHIDALSDGDPQGKGTGHGGHSHWLPNCEGPKGVIDYSNFDTAHGGGLYDIEGRNGIGGRNRQMAYSMYNYDNQYGDNIVDTSKNIQDGQVYLTAPTYPA